MAGSTGRRSVDVVCHYKGLLAIALCYLLTQPAASGRLSQQARQLLDSTEGSLGAEGNALETTGLSRVEQVQFKCNNSLCTSRAAPVDSPVVPTVSPQQWQGRCKQQDLGWLRSYVAWVQAQRRAMAQDPRAAEKVKFLVWRTVPPADHKPGQRLAGGLSDRLRGIMWLLQVAAAMKRYLLLQQTHPAPMERFFVPSLIDWSIGNLSIPEPTKVFYEYSRDRDIEKLSCTTTIHSHALTEYRQCMLGMLRDKRLYNDTDQFLFVGTNYYQYDPDIPWGHSVGKTYHNAHCMFTALFQASEESEAAALKQYQAMGIQPKPGPMPYVALHQRVGGSVGEPVLHFWDTHVPTEQEMRDLVTCAQDFYQSRMPSSSDSSREQHSGKSHRSRRHVSSSDTGSNVSGQKVVLSTGSDSRRQLAASRRADAESGAARKLFERGSLDSTQVVVVTDSPELRATVTNLNLSSVATTTTAQIHFDLFDHPMSPSDPLDRHLDVVADLVVLAKARCHVYNAGGFSKMARWWGNIQCYQSTKDCQAAHPGHQSHGQ